MRQVFDCSQTSVLAIALVLSLFSARHGLAQGAGLPGDGPLSRRQGAAGIINTHAEAHRRLPNTVSDAFVGIEVHARDVQGATSLLARQSQDLLSYLRAEKVERLRTEGVGVEPEMQEVHGQPDRITGYIGRTTVSFRITPDRLPLLLAGCLDHGANRAFQAGSSPREEEVEQARQKLAAEAARTALAQASTVALAIGAHDRRAAGRCGPIRRGRCQADDAAGDGDACGPARSAGPRGGRRCRHPGAGAGQGWDRAKGLKLKPQGGSREHDMRPLLSRGQAFRSVSLPGLGRDSPPPVLQSALSPAQGHVAVSCCRTAMPSAAACATT